jgi:hypothetical protein
MRTKRCEKCRRLYRIAAFDPHCRKGDGLQPFCRRCDYLAKLKPHRGYRRMLDAAVRKGKVVTLTSREYMQLIAADRCHWCDGPLRHWAGYWIDRVDNNEGYIATNCVPCCWPCNKFKATMDPYMWADIAAGIRQRRNAGQHNWAQWMPPPIPNVDRFLVSEVQTELDLGI